MVRQGLRLLLQREGLDVVGEAADGQEAVRLATESCPDVAVLDYGMPVMNGLGAAREIMQTCPLTKVILLTMHTDDRYVLEEQSEALTNHCVIVREQNSYTHHEQVYRRGAEAEIGRFRNFPEGKP